MPMTLDKGEWIDAARELASRAATPPPTELAQANLRVLLCILDRLDAHAAPVAPPTPAEPVVEPAPEPAPVPAATRRKR